MSGLRTSAAAASDRLAPRVRARIAAIAAESPAWHPWLALLRVTIDEIARDRLGAVVDVVPSPSPLLEGATISVSARAGREVVGAIVQTAARDGGPAYATLSRRAACAAIDAETLLEAAVIEDDGALRLVAAGCGVEERAFASLARLCAPPVLFAARAMLSKRADFSTPSRGCPVCGAAALLAESRGLAREHRRRCGRCGADWPAAELACAFCGIDDAGRLRSLVPEGKPLGRRVSACLACRGCLKILPTLEPLAPEQVLLEDLGSVDLDLAATSCGYARPVASPRRLSCRVLLDASR